MHVWSLPQAQPPVRQYCALFPNHFSDVLRAGEGSFIELGKHYVTTNEDRWLFIWTGNIDVGVEFEIEMDVLPTSTDHDGNLFAIGSKRVFPYYEWRTKANSTQYLVVEIVYSSVSTLVSTGTSIEFVYFQVVLTLKALGTYNLHSIELYRTHPNPYDIGDGNWHTIKGTWSVLKKGKTNSSHPLPPL